MEGGRGKGVEGGRGKGRWKEEGGGRWKGVRRRKRGREDKRGWSKRWEVKEVWEMLRGIRGGGRRW